MERRRYKCDAQSTGTARTRRPARSCALLQPALPGRGGAAGEALPREAGRAGPDQDAHLAVRAVSCCVATRRRSRNRKCRRSRPRRSRRGRRSRGSWEPRGSSPRPDMTPPAAQATPHAPQLASSDMVSMQPPPQDACPGGHGGAVVVVVVVTQPADRVTRLAQLSGVGIRGEVVSGPHNDLEVGRCGGPGIRPEPIRDHSRRTRSNCQRSRASPRAKTLAARGRAAARRPAGWPGPPPGAPRPRPGSRSPRPRGGHRQHQPVARHPVGIGAPGPLPVPTARLQGPEAQFDPGAQPIPARADVVRGQVGQG